MHQRINSSTRVRVKMRMISRRCFHMGYEWVVTENKQIKKEDKPLIMIIRQEMKEQASCTKLSFFFFWSVRETTNLKCTSIGGRVQDASKNRMEFMIPGKGITSRGFLTTTKEYSRPHRAIQSRFKLKNQKVETQPKKMNSPYEGRLHGTRIE